MKWLSIFARFGIMGAMVIALAYKMNESMTVTDWWEDALLVGAFLSAISFEFIGYLNGHSMEGYWRIGDYVKAGTSAVLLIVYSIVAIVILWDNESLRLLPVVAAIVYFSAPLVDGLGVMVVEQGKKSADDSEFRRQEQVKESQHRRDMEARQLEIDARSALQIQLAHEQAGVAIAAEKAKVSIANAEARKVEALRQDSGKMQDANKLPQVAAVSPQDASLPSDWRQLSRQQKHNLASSTREERESVFPELADRTRREWHSRLDKIAVQNGSYVA